MLLLRKNTTSYSIFYCTRLELLRGQIPVALIKMEEIATNRNRIALFQNHKNLYCIKCTRIRALFVPHILVLKVTSGVSRSDKTHFTRCEKLGNRCYQKKIINHITITDQSLSIPNMITLNAHL